MGRDGQSKILVHYWWMTLTMIKVNLLAQEITDKNGISLYFDFGVRSLIGPGNQWKQNLADCEKMSKVLAH